jgi:hypothetical protein
LGISWKALAGAEARAQDAREPVAMHAVVQRLRVLAVLASVIVGLLLAGGNGLPGLVQALASTEAHVCTCSTGGSHASCPVCSHALGASSRSDRPSFDGVPCGDRRVAAGALGDPALPAASFVVLPAGELTRLAHAGGTRSPSPRHVEPATPPPRDALPG